jgi:hypothetical protein
MHRTSTEAPRRLRVGVVLALIAAGLLVRAESPTRAQEKNDALRPDEVIARARLALGLKALGIIQRKTQLGPQVTNPVGDTYQWSMLRLGAQIYLSMGRDENRVEDPEVYLAVAKARPSRERMAAFQSHYDLMKAWEDRTRPLAEKTFMAPLDFLQIQEHRLQAELWLARERLKVAEVGGAKE